MNDITPAGRRARTAPAAAALVLAVAAVVLLFWRIGAYPLVDGDSAFYARVARNVLDSGDWLVLRFDPASPASDVDKPPLAIWMTAVVFRALGPTDFAARLWHATVAIALLALTAALAWRVAGRRAAFLATLVLLTSVLFFYQAREPMLDVPLAACLTAALWLIARPDTARFWPRYYAACAAIGAGIMIKGPVAAALAVVPMGVMMSAAARSRHLASRRLVAHALGGLAIVLVIVLPWHVWAFAKAGAPFAEMYSGTLTWRRYLQPQFPPGVAVVPYSLLALAGVLPWAGLAIPALRSAWRDRRANPARGCLCWYVLWTIAFFGLSPGNIIIRYVLPAVPACAVLIASLLDRPEPNALRAGALATIVLGLAMIPAAVAAALIDTSHPGLAALARAFLLVLGAAMVAGGIILFWGRVAAGAAMLAAGAAAGYLMVLALAQPVVDDLYPDRALAAVVNREGGPAARVAVFRAGAADSMLSFYLDARLERLATGEDVARFLSRPGPAWIVERSATPLLPALRGRLETVAARERAALLRTKE